MGRQKVTPVQYVSCGGSEPKKNFFLNLPECTSTKEENGKSSIHAKYVFLANISRRLRKEKKTIASIIALRRAKRFSEESIVASVPFAWLDRTERLIDRLLNKGMAKVAAGFGLSEEQTANALSEQEYPPNDSCREVWKALLAPSERFKQKKADEPEAARKGVFSDLSSLPDLSVLLKPYLVKPESSQYSPDESSPELPDTKVEGVSVSVLGTESKKDVVKRTFEDLFFTPEGTKTLPYNLAADTIVKDINRSLWELYRTEQKAVQIPIEHASSQPECEKLKNEEIRDGVPTDTIGPGVRRLTLRGLRRLQLLEALSRLILAATPPFSSIEKKSNSQNAVYSSTPSEPPHYYQGLHALVGFALFLLNERSTGVISSVPYEGVSPLSGSTDCATMTSVFDNSLPYAEESLQLINRLLEIYFSPMMRASLSELQSMLTFIHFIISRESAQNRQRRPRAQVRRCYRRRWRLSEKRDDSSASETGGAESDERFARFFANDARYMLLPHLLEHYTVGPDYHCCLSWIMTWFVCDIKPRRPLGNLHISDDGKDTTIENALLEAGNTPWFEILHFLFEFILCIDTPDDRGSSALIVYVCTALLILAQDYIFDSVAEIEKEVGQWGSQEGWRQSEQGEGSILRRALKHLPLIRNFISDKPSMCNQDISLAYGMLYSKLGKLPQRIVLTPLAALVCAAQEREVSDNKDTHCKRMNYISVCELMVQTVELAQKYGSPHEYVEVCQVYRAEDLNKSAGYRTRADWFEHTSLARELERIYENKKKKKCDSEKSNWNSILIKAIGAFFLAIFCSCCLRKKKQE